MGRRTLLLIAALVVAALGTVLVFLYAQNAQNAAQQGQTLYKVLVAKTKIEIGTTGTAASSSGAFEEQEVPKANLVDGAIADVAPISGLVALVPVFPGQQIIAQQWGAVAQTSGLSLPPGMIALSVQLGDPQRVAGFVSPGSNVAIFTYGDVSVPTTGTAAPNPPVAGVRALLANVLVIAVGPTTVVAKTSGTTSDTTSGTTNTEQIPTAILTLAVTQQQAEKIIYASGITPNAKFNGLYFGLMDKNSKVVPNDLGISTPNLFK